MSTGLSALYVVFAVLLLSAVALAAWTRKSRRQQQQFELAVSDALHRSFGDASVPKLTVGFSYGYPSFKLEFDSRANHQAAADSGAVARFMAEIQQLCRERGTKDNPFDARKALYCTDPEHQQALAKWGAEERRKVDAQYGKK